jgi:hypothetical protein
MHVSSGTRGFPGNELSAQEVLNGDIWCINDYEAVMLIL